MNQTPREEKENPIEYPTLSKTIEALKLMSHKLSYPIKDERDRTEYLKGLPHTD